MERNAFNHLFDMSEHTVIITGGTRGIGLSLAQGFALAGANVVVASRKSDACERAATRLRELGTKAIGVATHMGSVDDLDALVERAVAEFGGIDVVVNNAANALAEPLGSLTLQAWNKSFETNLRGPVFLVQKALPYLKESPGAAVLNVVAVSAFGFAPAVSMYAAGKSALMSFTRSMAAEFAQFGIRVNALAPGPVDTDMVRNNEPEFIDALSEATLQRRIATPDEMVAPALLLTAPGGSNITGQVLIVDGGGTPH